MTKLLAMILVLLTSCSGCATAPGSWGGTYDRSELRRQTEMKESFLIKKQVVYMSPPGSEKPLSAQVSAGTGFVVAAHGKVSMVMTAEHVCAVPEKIESEVDDVKIELPVVNAKFMLQDIEGDWHAAAVVYADSVNDVCVLSMADFKPPSVAKLASPSFKPPLGARLETSGAPGGEYDWHSSTLQEGFMTGFESFDGIIYLKSSIPIAPGASGSAVYYNGRVVGMVTRVYRGFHHISYLVTAEHLNSALREAEKRWRAGNR